MAIVLQAELPTSGVASYVAELAKRYGVRAMRMPLDDLADVVTRLSDDEVHGDATQEMIVALARAEVIDRRSMLSLLSGHLHDRQREHWGNGVVSIQGLDGLDGSEQGNETWSDPEVAERYRQQELRRSTS